MDDVQKIPSAEYPPLERAMRYDSTMGIRGIALTIFLGASLGRASAADKAAQAVSPSPPGVTASHVSVLTGDQVVQILDQTVDWYRTLGHAAAILE